MNKPNVNFAQYLAAGAVATAFVVLAVAPVSAADDTASHAAHAHYAGNGPSSSALIAKVRNATRQYIDINAATTANYQRFLGCVSGPDQGAMGIHYVNFGLVGDGELDAAHPEALIYEPVNGGLQLVGVEFIVDAATWLAAHDNQPPVLEGQSFQLIGIPNRFGLPAPFFELHVWAWRDSPTGAFVDWNTKVSCEGE